MLPAVIAVSSCGFFLVEVVSNIIKGLVEFAVIRSHRGNDGVLRVLKVFEGLLFVVENIHCFLRLCKDISE